ncbi:MAG: tetratricopeptide repeat protein [Planctomycetaceae bacterium]|nr:tetratricopeptide repeat protein [Planctomycetaceae bacterium]
MFACSSPLTTRATTLVAVLLTIIAIGPQPTASADDNEKVEALRLQFWDLYEADKLTKAEKVARQMIQIGESNQANDPTQITWGWDCLGQLEIALAHYRPAAALLEQSARVRLEAWGEDDYDYAETLSRLGDAYVLLGRFTDADREFQKALKIQIKEYGEDSEEVAYTRQSLGALALEIDKPTEAEALFKASLAVMQREYGADSVEAAYCHDYLATVYTQANRFAEALAAAKLAQSIYAKQYEPGHSSLAVSLETLAEIDFQQGKYQAAEQKQEQARKIYEAAFGSDNSAVASAIGSIGRAQMLQGHLRDAENNYKKSLAIYEKNHGADHPNVATALYQLAGLRQLQGRFVESDALYQRALKIREAVFGHDNVLTAWVRYEMSILEYSRDRYAEAEALCADAVRVIEGVYGKTHVDVALFKGHLADIYLYQERVEESQELHQEVLRVREELLGSEHIDTAWALVGLALVEGEREQYDRASELIDRAIAIGTAAGKDGQNDLGTFHAYLGELRLEQKRWDEAEAAFQVARRILAELGDDQTPVAAQITTMLAKVYLGQDRRQEAEVLLDQGIAVLDRTGAFPSERFEAYLLRARNSWASDRRSEALADLRSAMSLAEEHRTHISGGERERARTFVNFAEGYEQMVAWQLAQGDVAEALGAMERARSRSMLDELAISGSSLEVGRSAVEREQLRQREAELTSRVAELETQLAAVRASDEATSGSASKQQLEQDLARARTTLYDHYRDARSNNPVYRNLLSAGTTTLRLSQIQRELVGENSLALVYFIGKSSGYLAILTSDAARLVELSVSEDAAQTLGIAAGPLTHDELNLALAGDGGVLSALASPDNADKVTAKLRVLWDVLVPATEQAAIVGGGLAKLIVLPDGPLALLPFEALVVERGDAPTYLIDVGPPMHYGPSATILMNLRQRTRAATQDENPVLSVGDPQYSPASQSESDTTSDSQRMQTRYTSLGGKLPRLPFTALESTWVNDVFDEQGISVQRLVGEDATEANVRNNSLGRRYLHLACHGLTDQSHGNLFGSLALTPGAGTGDPANDGFLTLAEIYELNLHGCELTILSACNTNYGPQQRGEGVWALSRGFLVAGSRRVVASNWVVDDQAGASLISYFASGLANAEKKQVDVDYASSLHAAKKWVRQQDKWSSPYYWATFVLVGPN